MFPYHYGSHATYLTNKVVDDESCFHTTMVLTQRCSIRSRKTRKRNSFHTTMVLTQRSEHGPGGNAGAYKFPYHYGSHATQAILLHAIAYQGFHTTMVLTQRSTRRIMTGM